MLSQRSLTLQACGSEQPELRDRPTPSLPDHLSASRVGRPLVIVVLVALTMLAGGLRSHDLAAPNGRLSRDEAKVALAADGVLRTGLPVMPSGRIYTRGMLTSYLVAGSFAALGPSDLAARLPSVIAGLLLVPLVYLMARSLGGPIAGLGAAGVVAVAEPLVEWSASAWLPSLHLLLQTLTIYCCYRGFVQSQGRWQVLGGIALILSLLAYEFAILVLGAVGLFLAIQLARRDLSWYRGRPTVLALGLLAGSGLLFCCLALAARAGTLAGPLSEIQGYVAPGVALARPLIYIREFFAKYAALIAMAVIGLPFLVRAHPPASLLLALLLLLIVLVPAFVFQTKTQIRYVLPSLPLLAIVGASGVVLLLGAAARRMRMRDPWRAAVTAVLVLAAMFGALYGDLSAASARLQRPASGATWLQTLREQPIHPDDLVLTEGPERLRFYVGRADYHVYSQREFNAADRSAEDDQDRYSYAAADGVRSIYANSLLLGRRGDFEQLVERPNHGRILWVIGRASTLKHQTDGMDPNLWPSLARSAGRQVTRRDDWIIMRIALPLRYRHS